MTNEEHRAQVELELIALKQEGEQLRNDLTRNMNALNLKVDLVASELREGQRQLTANVNQLTATVSQLSEFVKQVCALQIGPLGRIRGLETLPPQTA